MKQKTVFLTTIIIIFTLFKGQAQHQWTRTNLGGGGAISMVGSTVSGRLVVGADLSGVYTSTNNGASWTDIGATQGLLETHISAFGFHPIDGDTFIIGTAIGAYKTIDGGVTVNPVQIEVDPTQGLGYVESIGMAINNANVGYMAHYESWLPTLSFLKTNDAGDTWTKVATSGIPVDARIVKIIVDANNENIVYALTGKARFACSLPKLYRSTDGGQNWTEIGGTYPAILDVDLHPTDSNIIYITTFVANACSSEMYLYVGGDENSGATYKSTNAGNTFTQICDKTGIISVGNNPSNITIIDYLYLADWNANAGTWKTIDAGTNWTKTASLSDWDMKWAHPDYAYVFSFNGLNKTLVKNRFNPDNINASFGQWSWSTFDGGNVLVNNSSTLVSPGHFISTGVENIEGNAIDISDVNPNTIYVGSYDIGFYYSRDHGASWKWSIPDYATYPDYVWWNAGGSNCNFVLNDPDRENVVWTTFGSANNSTSGAIFKSTAFGENWQISNTGLNPLGLNTHGMSIDLTSPITNRTLYVTQAGDVYKSINDGANWTKVFTNGGLKFTAVDQQNGQVVYAGGSSGLFKSTNAGTTWNEIGQSENFAFTTSVQNAVMRNDIVPTYDDLEANPPVVAWQGVFEIKTDPNIPNRVYVVAYGTNKGLYRSDDAGLNWTKIYANNKMRGVAIAPQDSNIIYATSSLNYHSGGFSNESKGIFYSTDAGQTWTMANEGMPWTNGGKIEIETGVSPNVWAWSPGTGVQYSPVPSNILGLETMQLENSILYPNPVENNLTIRSKLLKTLNDISVYNVIGKKIANFKFNSTTNTVDVTKLSSGIYFLKITSISNSEVIKFIKK